MKLLLTILSNIGNIETLKQSEAIMEYLKLTDGNVTVKVQDQANEVNAAWIYQVVIKQGKGRFQEVNSTTTLEAATGYAIQEFRNASDLWSKVVQA
jgi:hypothetical protein